MNPKIHNHSSLKPPKIQPSPAHLLNAVAASHHQGRQTRGSQGGRNCLLMFVDWCLLCDDGGVRQRGWCREKTAVAAVAETGKQERQKGQALLCGMMLAGFWCWEDERGGPKLLQPCLLSRLLWLKTAPVLLCCCCCCRSCCTPAHNYAHT